jgi:hypothetical protein
MLNNPIPQNNNLENVVVAWSALIGHKCNGKLSMDDDKNNVLQPCKREK